MSLNNYVIGTDEVQRYLFKQGYEPVGDADSDLLLESIRQTAVDRIKQYLGYSYTSQSYSDVRYSGDGTHFLYLRHRPITTLTSISIDDSTYSTSAFDITDGNRLYYEDGYFSEGIKNVKLTYTAGWTRVTMPATIRFCALKLCGFYWNMQTREGIQSESREDGTTHTYDLEQEEQILQTIYQYAGFYSED